MSTFYFEEKESFKVNECVLGWKWVQILVHWIKTVMFICFDGIYINRL